MENEISLSVSSMVSCLLAIGRFLFDSERFDNSVLQRTIHGESRDRVMCMLVIMVSTTYCDCL